VLRTQHLQLNLKSLREPLERFVVPPMKGTAVDLEQSVGFPTFEYDIESREAPAPSPLSLISSVLMYALMSLLKLALAQSETPQTKQWIRLH
jgi:hypothetical protein